MSDNSPPGFPGLETMLPLLLTAVNKGQLTLQVFPNFFEIVESNASLNTSINQNLGCG